MCALYIYIYIIWWSTVFGAYDSHRKPTSASPSACCRLPYFICTPRPRHCALYNSVYYIYIIHIIHIENRLLLTLRQSQSSTVRDLLTSFFYWNFQNELYDYYYYYVPNERNFKYLYSYFLKKEKFQFSFSYFQPIKFNGQTNVWIIIITPFSFDCL